MWGDAATIITAAAPLGAAAPIIERRVDVSGPTVPLGAIFDLSRLPTSLRLKAEPLAVVSFAPNKTEVLIPASQAAERARAFLPALGPWLSAKPGEVISVNRPTASPTPARASSTSLNCIRLTRDVVAGGALGAKAIEPAPCSQAILAVPLYYRPAQGVMQVTRNLKAGEIFAGLRPAPDPVDGHVRRGSERGRQPLPRRLPRTDHGEVPDHRPDIPTARGPPLPRQCR